MEKNMNSNGLKIDYLPQQNEFEFKTGISNDKFIKISSKFDSGNLWKAEQINDYCVHILI
jgi:hypothetical protein